MTQPAPTLAAPIGVRPYPADQIERVDWIPAALLVHTVDAFRGESTTYLASHDDLDVFVGVHGIVDGQPFAIRRYKGFPEGLVQIYFHHEFCGPRVAVYHATIHALVQAVMTAYGLTEECRLWQFGEDLEMSQAPRSADADT